MGRESSVERDRVCKECKRPFYTTATEMNEHAQFCKRAQAIGLQLASHPRNPIVRPNRRVMLDDM